MATLQDEPSRGNREAWRLATEWIRSSTPTVCLIHGDVGTGKTHLAAAMARDECERFTGIRFVVEQEFYDDVRASFDGEGENESVLVTRAKTCPLLILDDFGMSKQTEWNGALLFTILNTRYNSRLRTLLTSNLDRPRLMKRIDQRLSSRLFGDCLDIALVGRDRRVQ